jgi:hypothetical protein
MERFGDGRNLGPRLQDQGLAFVAQVNQATCRDQDLPYVPLQYRNGLCSTRDSCSHACRNTVGGPLAHARGHWESRCCVRRRHSQSGQPHLGFAGFLHSLSNPSLAVVHQNSIRVEI